MLIRLARWLRLLGQDVALPGGQRDEDLMHQAAQEYYRRNLGRLIAASTADGDIAGRIAGVTDTEVTLDVSGTPRTLPVEAIDRAVVQVELNRSIDDEE